jgi:MFS family permease
LYGRRGTLFAGAVVFSIGGAVQTFTTGFKVMVVGRIISGFGVGLLSYVRILLVVLLINPLFRTIVPIYQSEVSPPNHVGTPGRHIHACTEVIYSGERLLVWNLPEIFSAMRFQW